MNESDSATRVREALDQAISEVVEAEYGRLADGMTQEDRIESVDSGLKSLTRLQQGIPPDYGSEWVALFYLCWYQPRQIHLAYAALRGVLEQSRLPMHVIDYGCGALAVQVALAMIVAEDEEALDAGLAVYGVDPDLAMVGIGKKLWRQFLEVVGARIDEDPFFLRLRLAVESIGEVCSCHTSFCDALECQQAGRASASDGCWITAVHAQYPSNRTELKDVLEPAKCQEWGSALELVTFFETPISRHFFEKLGFSRIQLGMQAWEGRLDAYDSLA